jgi:hypothetical protein
LGAMMPRAEVQCLPPEAIHRSACNRYSANFAVTEFYEVGSEVRLVASCLL